jgi:hypothetical protein
VPTSPKPSEQPRKIREFLSAVGITEVTYQALRRHGAVSFMPRRIKGQGDFTYAQLLALKCFALLRAHGLNIQFAAEAVEAAFSQISLFATQGELEPESAYKVGVQIVATRGKLTVAHLNSREADGVIQVGSVAFDLRGVSSMLPEVQRC